MGLTNGGRDLIAAILIGEGVAGDWFDASNAHIGVGNTNTEFAATQTQLEGERLWETTGEADRQGMEAAHPARTENAIDFKASFGADDANFAWLEWGVFNDDSAGLMLNRKVENLGTKAGGTWVLTVTLTVNIGT